MNSILKKIIYSIIIGLVFFSNSSCTRGKKVSTGKDGNTVEHQASKNIELRITKLENKLNKYLNETRDNKIPNNSRINTLTFRLGTADDRLRIYWMDGGISDLPCEKEETTWICG